LDIPDREDLTVGKDRDFEDVRPLGFLTREIKGLARRELKRRGVKLA